MQEPKLRAKALENGVQLRRSLLFLRQYFALQLASSGDANRPQSYEEGEVMSLMVKARWAAFLHVVATGSILNGNHHRIWRLYRYFGFDTRAVFCSCGKLFGEIPTGGTARILREEIDAIKKAKGQ